MEKILLFRWGGLGDLCVALPSIQLIRKTYADARITLVCQRGYGELMAKTRLVDALVDGDSPQLLPLFAARADEAAARPDWFHAFGLVVGWFSGKKKGDLERNLEGVYSGKLHLIYYHDRIQEQMSVFFFRKTAEALDRKDISFEECATLSFDSGGAREGPNFIAIEGKKGIGKYIVVHPGSGSEEKCWPLPRFLAILERLARTGLGGVLVTGEAEARMQPILEKTALPEAWSWVRCPSLSELCGLLRGAALYVGNDSGVTHLAAACGARVLALFRRDRENAWRPFGQTKILSADDIEDIELEAVWRKISYLLASG